MRHHHRVPSETADWVLSTAQEFLPAGVHIEAVTIDTGLIEELTDAERRQASGMSLTRLREFASGRYCARRALVTAGGKGESIPIRPDRSPAWPKGFVGSISHTHDTCVAIVAASQQFESIGIDLEENKPFPAEGVRIITSARDGARPKYWPDNTQYYTLLFSIKETVYKTIQRFAAANLTFQDADVLIDSSQRSFCVQMQRGYILEHQRMRRLSGRWASGKGALLSVLTLPSATTQRSEDVN